jgi:hypothetical protein
MLFALTAFQKDIPKMIDELHAAQSHKIVIRKFADGSQNDTSVSAATAVPQTRTNLYFVRYFVSSAVRD